MKQKKFFISADIEGITDVTSWSETEKGQDGYERAVHQMTMEVAAASRALLEAGHSVTVRDGHGTARNMDHEQLPRETRLYRGWAGEAGSMLAGLDETYDGVLYIGYHAPAGSDGSPLAHTIDRKAIRKVKIDGQLASEFTMNRLFAQSLGVPSLMISGDEAICQLARLEVPQIVSVAVKKGRGSSTLNMHPADACEKIYQAVSDMLEQLFDAEGHCLVNAGVCKKEYLVNVEPGAPAQQKKRLTGPGIEWISEHEVQFIAYSPTEINLFMDQVIAACEEIGPDYEAEE